MEIEKDFLYINGRSWRTVIGPKKKRERKKGREKEKKKKGVESRGVESALPRDYHLNDIGVRYAYIYIYLYSEEIYIVGKIRTPPPRYTHEGRVL